LSRVPKGIANAFILAESFIGQDNVALILGDNIFYGNGLENILKSAIMKKTGATVFGYYVTDPKRFGVVEFDEMRKAISLEEKPSLPKSNYAVTGLIFYDNRIVDIVKSILPPSRGELEITDVNIKYLEKDELNVNLLGPGFAWIDTGTHTSLLAASNFIEMIDKMQNIKIGCIEEVAFKMGYISKDQLILRADPLMKNDYGKYLTRIANCKSMEKRSGLFDLIVQCICSQVFGRNLKNI
jgi:glucose-1-phosphate thymidylyltransferase